MSDAPTFTVLLPAKGRPHLVRDALVSVLDQSFRDLEVIVSNNGADSAVRAAIADRLGDPRVRYLEQATVLPMPEHWERISQLARGRYLTVLPDRSVLKQGALGIIAELHARCGADAEIVTWSWDLYFTESGFMQPVGAREASSEVLDSETVALDSLRLGVVYPTAMPRGLNSSVSLALVNAIRNRVGAVFLPLAPDFSFAYACLLSHSRVTHLAQPLMISQGLSVSNGGNAFLTDARDYVDTLGITKPVCHSPIKELFVENLIIEDFISACCRFGRLDLLARMDWTDLYLKCLSELDEKRAAGLLQPARIEELASAVEAALAQEGAEVRARVHAERNRPIRFETQARRTVKRLLGAHIERLQPLLIRLRGGKRFESALQAAGHQD